MCSDSEYTASQSVSISNHVNSKSMTIQEAIEKAVQGGWDKSTAEYDFDPSGGAVELMLADAFLDPLFWQSLGKAIGWSESVDEFDGSKNFEPGSYNYRNGITEWKYQWHRFIDHLAEGKNAESFFKNL